MHTSRSNLVRLSIVRTIMGPVRTVEQVALATFEYVW